MDAEYACAAPALATIIYAEHVKRKQHTKGANEVELIYITIYKCNGGREQTTIGVEIHWMFSMNVSISLFKIKCI